MVSLKDIAKKAGASPSTVSFVLNGKDKEMRISAELAEKIRKVAQTEGYQPNQIAVSLRTGKSKIIGLMVDAISGNFFASLARIIESEVESQGYKVIYCSTGNDTQKGRDLIKMFHQYHVDGYLIIPSAGMDKDIETLMLQKKPLVLMDSYFPGTVAPYVLVDNFNGISKGVKYLLKKGYKKIGFVCNDVELVQMKERKKAFTETMKQNNNPVKKNWVLQTGYNSPKEEVTKQITAFIQQVKPEAILFGANYLGVCGLESISNLGLKIPDDIAVLCFDDHEVFKIYPPGITSIKQPVEEIAKTAIDILMGEMKIKKKVKKNQVQIEATLIERASA